MSERLRTRSLGTPGALLFRHFLLPLLMSPQQAAEELGMAEDEFNLFLMNRVPVTPDIAERLARVFHTTPELWLHLQRAYDAWHAGRPYCFECRLVGMLHCSEPEHCSGMVYPEEKVQ